MSLFTITALLYSCIFITLFLAVSPFATIGGDSLQDGLTKMLIPIAPAILSPIVLAIVFELLYRLCKNLRTSEENIKVLVPKRQIAGQLVLTYVLFNLVAVCEEKGFGLLLFLLVMGCTVLFRKRINMGYPFWYLNFCSAVVIGLSIPISLVLNSWIIQGASSIDTTETISDLKRVITCVIFGVGSYIHYRHSLKHRT